MIPTDKILRRMDPADRKKPGKAGARTEKELHYDIIKLLRQNKIAFLHSRMDKRTRCTVGWPDFTFAMDGQPFVIEVKTIRTGRA